MRRSGSVHPGFPYNSRMQRLLLTAIAVLGAVAFVPGALAGEGDRTTVARSVAPPARVLAEGLTLDEAVARVEAQYGARAVRAEEDRDGERRVYRIRLLSPDGRVFEVTVDAATGEVE